MKDGSRYGPVFWQIIGLLSTDKVSFENKAELVRELTRINRRPVARQQVYTIIKEAIDGGFLNDNPFTAQPQMARDYVRHTRRGA